MDDRDTVDTHGVSRRRLLLGGAAAAGAGWIAPAIVSAPAHAQGSTLAWVVRITDGGCTLDVGFPYCRRPPPSAVVYIDANQDIVLFISYYLPDGSLFRTECTTAGPARGLFAVGWYICPSMVRPNPTLEPGFRTVVSRVTSCPGGAVLETVESVALGCPGPGIRRDFDPDDPDMPEILLP